MKKWLIGLISAVLFIPVMQPAVASESTAPYSSTTLQESDGSMSYTGNWETLNGEYNGGSAVYSKEPNASASFQFDGVGFRYIGEVAPHNDKIDILIDGQYAASIKPNSGPKGTKSILYEVTGLAEGKHSVILQASGKANKKNEKYTMNLDAIELLTSVSAPVPGEGDGTDSDPIEAEPGTEHNPPVQPGDLVVESRVPGGDANDNQIQTYFNIKNHSTSSVPLSELSIRYWFTKEDAVDSVLQCDWAVAGCGKIKGQFHEANADKADTYVEIAFAPDAGTLSAGGASGEIQTRIHKSNWSKYAESNDYSYQEPSGQYRAWDHITLYRNGQLIWGIEPSPLSNPVQKLTVSYRNNDRQASNNQISPFLAINNIGDIAVPMSELKVRYWYTKDSVVEQQFFCDWSPIGCNQINGVFGSIGTQDYAEISFANQTGTLARGATSGIIQLRISNKDWSNYDESNDYSYLASSDQFVDAERITLYRNGQLIWGVEPLSEVPSLEIPNNVTAQLQAGGVHLAWESSSSHAEFQIYRAYGDLPLELAASGVTERTYVDTTVPTSNSEELMVRYAVSQLDGSGQESDKSEVLTVIIPAASTPKVPSMPQGIDASVADNAVSVQWSAASNADGYHIYRSIAGEPYLRITDSPVREPAYIDESQSRIFLHQETAVSYKVSAVTAAGLESEASAPVTVSISASIAIRAAAVCDPSSGDEQWAWTLHNDNKFDVPFQGVQGERIVTGTIPALGTYTLTIPAADGLLSVTVQGIPQVMLDPSDIACEPGPSLVSASALSKNEIVLRFDKALDPTSAVVKDNYIITDTAAGTRLAALEAIVGDDASQVRLVSGDQAPGAEYAILIQNVYGQSGQKLEHNSAIVKGFVGERAVPSQTGNQLLNGGFEQTGGPSGAGSKWVKWITPGVTDTVQVVNDPIATGVQAQRIAGSGLASGSVVMLYQEIPVKSGNVFEATGKLNVASLVDSRVEFYVEFYDGSGSRMSVFKQDILSATGGYTDARIRERIPATATKARVQVILRATANNASGLAYADDLFFRYDGNQLLNGDYEQYTGTNGTANKWIKWTTPGVTDSVQVVNDPVAGGSRAQRVAGNDLSNGSTIMLYQEIPIEGGKVFEATGQLNVESLANGRVEFYIDFYDGSGSRLSVFKQELSAPTTGYVAAGIRERTPPTAVKGRVNVILRATGANASGVAYADNLTFGYSDNQLLNGNYELNAGTNGAANKWVKWVTPGVTDSVEVVKDPVAGGGQAQRIAGSGLASGSVIMLYQDIPAEAGKVFEATAKLNVQELVDSRVEYYIDFYDLAGTRLNVYKQEITAPTGGYIDARIRERVPAAAAKARVYVILRALGGNASGIAYADDVTFAYDGNRLLNGGFEQNAGTNGTANKWVKWITPGVTDSVNVVNDPAAGGSQAQRVAGSDLTGGSVIMVYQDVPAEAGTVFEAAGELNVESLANSRIEFYVDFYNSAGTRLSVYKQDITEPTGGYIDVIIRERVPAAAVKARVYVILRATGDNASGTAYADNITFHTS
jgi:hypothetical protein